MPDTIVTLINRDTQLPEAVSIDQATKLLGAGTHQQYEGSDVVQEGVLGTESAAGSYGLERAQERAAAGIAQDTGARARIGAEARIAAQRKEYDNLSDEVLAALDGGVQALSGGLLDGLPTGGNPLDDIARKLRQDVNPLATTLGSVAATAATVFSNPAKAALSATPLGAANRLQEVIAAGVKGTNKVAQKQVVKTAAGEALGGAAAAALLSSGQQISNAINGKPVSADAIVDDVGLGVAIGGAVGLVGGVFGRSAQKFTNAKEEVEAAARFDEVVPKAQSAVQEAGLAWDSAFTEAERKMAILNKLEGDGLLDAQMLGEEWLATRREAFREAKRARDGLLGGTRSKSIPEAMDKIRGAFLTEDGKLAAKWAQRIDDFGEAVNRLDEVMKPTNLDQAHLLAVNGLDDLDTTMAAVDHPLNVLGRMVEQGADDETLRAFAKANDLGDITVGELEASARAAKTVRDAPDTVMDDALRQGRMSDNFDVSDTRGSAISKFDVSEMDRPGGSGGRFDVSDVETINPGVRRAGDEVTPDFDPRPRDEIGDLPGVGRQTRQVDTGASQRPTRQIIKERPEPQTAPAEPAVTNRIVNRPVTPQSVPAPLTDAIAAKTLPKLEGVAGLYGEAATKAHRILNEARWAKSAYPKTALGDRLTEIQRNLEEMTQGRLGTVEARELAKSLGVTEARSPLAQAIQDIWALRRLARDAAKEATVVGRAVRRGKGSTPGALAKAIRNGASTKTRYAVRTAIGPFSGGFTGSLVGSAVSAVLGTAGSITASAGRMRQAAVLGIAKALNPAGRRALSLSLVTPEISYDGSEPTTNYAKKAEQLQTLVANSDLVKQRAGDAFKELGLLDPDLATRAALSAQRRIENLAARLPKGKIISPFLPPLPPSVDEIDDFTQYEAVTHDRDRVFSYIRVGAMPDSVVSAMREQHPDFLAEIQEELLSNPALIESAPYESKRALSKLLGVALVPEADPLYIKYQQVQYEEKRQKAAQAQMSQQGASMMRGGMPAAPPATPAQQFTNLPAVR